MTPTAALHPPEQAAERTAPTMPARKASLLETASGCPRNFLDNRFVYTVISARARGFSIGVNLNPDKKCNFDCVYCEVDRTHPGRESNLDVEAMSRELQRTLAMVHSGQIRQIPFYSGLPDELLELRHVALSGDGEPTLCPNFSEAVQSIIHVRALGKFPFFKIVLITNATGLDLPPVQSTLKLLNKYDEVWAKLDAGSQSYMDRVNRPQAPLTKVLANILTLARQRPVVIQSLFPAIDGQEPPTEEIEQYARRLLELKAAGANIPLVQIYSATRPTAHSLCGHLPLKCLSHIAQTVRNLTGLKAEAF